MVGTSSSQTLLFGIPFRCVYVYVCVHMHVWTGWEKHGMGLALCRVFTGHLSHTTLGSWYYNPLLTELGHSSNRYLWLPSLGQGSWWSAECGVMMTVWSLPLWLSKQRWSRTGLIQVSWTHCSILPSAPNNEHGVTMVSYAGLLCWVMRKEKKKTVKSVGRRLYIIINKLCHAGKHYV